MHKSLINWAAAAALITPLALWAGGKQCTSGASSCGDKASLVSTGEQCTEKTAAACTDKGSLVSTGDKAAGCAEKTSVVSTGEKSSAKASCCPTESSARDGTMLVSTGAVQPMESLKTLAGKWKMVDADQKHEGASDIEFKVSSGGSTIVETMFPGSAHEMTNVYMMDGENLLVTHYCAMGNAPRMKMTSNDGGTMKFEFHDATNLPDKKKMYMGKLELTIVSPDQIRETWTSYVNGQEDSNHATFTLERVK